MINLIYAKTLEGVIGKDNKLPWHFKTDLQHFKEKTLNQIVVMGSKTYDSLPVKPLPNRTNLILTSQHQQDYPDFTSMYYQDKLKSNDNTLVGYINSIDTILKINETIEKEKLPIEIYLIGGKSLIELGIKELATNVYTTIIYYEYEGDTIVDDSELSSKFTCYGADYYYEKNISLSIFHFKRKDY